jgi:hypothetical protein
VDTAPEFDFGQARVNRYHHPERMLMTHEAAPERDDEVGSDEVA